MRNGKNDCIITSEKRYSTDLPQGGLKIPYKLLFSGKHEEISKLKNVFFPVKLPEKNFLFHGTKRLMCLNFIATKVLQII